MELKVWWSTFPPPQTAAHAALRGLLLLRRLEKELLKVQLDVYEAEFERARHRFTEIQFPSYSDKEKARGLLDRVADMERRYKDLESQIQLYLHSSYTASYCDSTDWTQKNLSNSYLSLTVQRYIDLVNNLSQLFPLSEEVANLAFHAQLLTGNYDELQTLGDRTLSARGQISIPFYSFDRFFWVVIDVQKRRLYTRPDEHHFSVAYPVIGNRLRQQEASVNEWLSPMVPFDLSFTDVTGLSQKAGRHFYSMVSKSYALKLDPTGTAPNYALMNILYCKAGERAELIVTRNLGRFISHVLGKTELANDLADPTKAKGQSDGWATGLMILGAMAPQTPLQSFANETVKTQMKEQTSALQPRIPLGC